MSWPLRKSSSSSLSGAALANSSLNRQASTQIHTNQASNVGLVPRAVQMDFDKEERKIQSLETTNKKFYKDVKTYVEKIDELNKSETKMINNLSHLATHASNSTGLDSSSVSNHDEDKEFMTKLKLWKDLLNEHNLSCDSLKQSCQQQVIEPMKKLNSLFPQVYEAIKRRQQAYNELTRQQSKLDKALEKERTGPQIVRNEQLKQLVLISKQQFDREHSLLMEELPKLYNSRVDYIRPCVQALLQSQANFYDNYTSFYDSILDCHQNDSLISSTNNKEIDQSNAIINIENEHNLADKSIQINEQIDDEIQKCLNEIKSLSIVAGD